MHELATSRVLQDEDGVFIKHFQHSRLRQALENPGMVSLLPGESRRQAASLQADGGDEWKLR